MSLYMWLQAASVWRNLPSVSAVAARIRSPIRKTRAGLEHPPGLGEGSCSLGGSGSGSLGVRDFLVLIVLESGLFSFDDYEDI